MAYNVSAFGHIVVNYHRQHFKGGIIQKTRSFPWTRSDSIKTNRVPNMQLLRRASQTKALLF